MGVTNLWKRTRDESQWPARSARRRAKSELAQVCAHHGYEHIYKTHARQRATESNRRDHQEQVRATKFNLAEWPPSSAITTSERHLIDRPYRSDIGKTEDDRRGKKQPHARLRARCHPHREVDACGGVRGRAWAAVGQREPVEATKSAPKKLPVPRRSACQAAKVGPRRRHRCRSP